MSTDKDTLLGMGFDPARVEWALRATNGRGLQPAMDHLIEHEGEAIPAPGKTAAPARGSASAAIDVDVDGDDDEEGDEDARALRAALKMSTGEGGTSAGDVGGDVEAKSIKCSECGKVFKNTALANFHAEKSGHDQFEESVEEVKPLTEPERLAKLSALRSKMAEKRAVQATAAAAEAKANEALRRKAGHDMNQLREELKAKEVMKEAEQRRRDKVEDARARAAIKAQIEADKRTRAEKAAREKALRDGGGLMGVPAGAGVGASSSHSSGGQASAGATANTNAAVTPSASGKEYKETRLQIRMASGGQPYTTTLSSDATLREVAEYLAGQTLSVDVDTVSFTQHFPRKTFTLADFSRTLKELGLTPSAVLIATTAGG